MRYSDTNVSRWFREELADFVIAALRKKGPLSKGALITAVMQERGLKPNGGNMLIRAHVDELERRGVLVSQKLLKERRRILIDLAKAVGKAGGDGGCDDKLGSLSDGASVVPRDADVRNPARADSRALFDETITGLALRMREVAENSALQNEAIALLIREVSHMRQTIGMFLQSMNARFAQNEEVGSRQYAEVLQKLSEIFDAFSENNFRNGDDALRAALGDLSKELHDPDDVVLRLGSSHVMLRELLAERDGPSHNTAR